MNKLENQYELKVEGGKGCENPEKQSRRDIPVKKEAQSLPHNRHTDVPEVHTYARVT